MEEVRTYTNMLPPTDWGREELYKIWHADVSFSTNAAFCHKKEEISSSLDELETSKRQGLIETVNSVDIDVKYFTAVLATCKN